MGMSGFAFKLAPLCVQGGVYSQDVKGLSIARRDALSMITADHSPHVNRAAKCPDYSCVSVCSSTDECMCSFSTMMQRIEEKINSRYDMYVCWPISALIYSFGLCRILAILPSLHLLSIILIILQLRPCLTLSFSRLMKGDQLKGIRRSEEDVCISYVHITSP